MCLYPKLIRNRKYTRTKKNGGNVPICNDNRLLYITAACGKCWECRKQNSRQWLVRMSEETRDNPNAIFVTLTIDDENYTKLVKKINNKDENAIATEAVKQFVNRIKNKHKKRIKHWLITEIGHTNTERVHLHGIIWDNEATIKTKEHWKYGYVFIGEYVNEKTIGYITKYITKIDEEHRNFNGKILCSPGIGKNYINRIDSNNNKYKENKTNETYRLRNGQKINLPTYYRNKIYTEEERELLWKEKLDKGDVWICGEKVNINNTEEYNKTLTYYRNKAIREQGDNEIKWEENKYFKRLAKQREKYKK